MKLLISSFLIIIIGTLISCSKPLSEKVKEANSDDPEIAKLKEVLKTLHETRKGAYSYITVREDMVRVYIGDVLKIASFLESWSKNYAREDLDIFLIKTGQEIGTIEYYDSTNPPSPKIIFSISGSLYSEEITRY